MHPTAMMNAQNFFDCYSKNFLVGEMEKVKVIEIGSQDVNGSIRDKCPQDFEYIGVDFVEGKGVDLILDDPYRLPFDTGYADIVVSSSCFEHSEMFWVLFLEIVRILKPRGLLYLNVPSNGEFHRYPVDCWRFYPDSGRALISWAKRNGINAALLESYTSTQIGDRWNDLDQWNDFVAVFLKDENFISTFPNRIIDSKEDFSNGLIYNNNDFFNYGPMPEDKKKILAISQIISNQIKVK
ncbi:methyltransferase domain-containing protein [Chitinimonas sp. BJB300]|uniref:methyltransferase domain-containing protein n=1 Tax=Chitinimonas sp. BJB300 TaxID=1559339 RepID=UPI000C0EBF6D|nr:methyltransferase domain-containing protein [Chitinimonas sp. BJB300]PHV10199.1 methyltransferase type 11 [Chitinimonas sp. BJB300]TSJ83029.1 class I SAM-dependent methyltransferase [Chitinimonas sp. BJB300]